jgi:hypothetical protein
MAPVTEGSASTVYHIQIIQKIMRRQGNQRQKKVKKNVSQAFWTQADLHHRNSWSCLAHHFAALAGWTKAANVYPCPIF